MHQYAFDEIRNRLLKPPAFHLQDSGDGFQLFSDTGKTAEESTPCLIQNSIPYIIGYTSKSLPLAAANYCITELLG